MKFPKLNLKSTGSSEGPGVKRLIPVIAAVAVIILLVIIILFRLGSASSGSGVSVNDIRKRGTLICAVPFLVEDGSPADTVNPDGLSLTKEELGVVNSLSEALGVPAVLLGCADAQAAVQAVREKHADIAIGGLSSSLRVPSGLRGSDSYAASKIYVVTRRGDYSDSLGAFDTRNHACSGAIGASGVMPAGPEGSEGVRIMGSDSAVRMLKEKTLDGWFADESEVLKTLDADSGLQAQLVNGMLPVEYTVYTAAGSSELLTGINRIIALLAQGE